MFGFGKKEKEAEAAAPQAGAGEGLFARFRRGLAKTAEVLNTPVGELFSSPDREKAYADLELALIRADVGLELSSRIVKDVREREKTAATPMDALRDELLAVLTPKGAVQAAAKPAVTPQV